MERALLLLLLLGTKELFCKFCRGNFMFTGSICFNFSVTLNYLILDMLGFVYNWLPILRGEWVWSCVTIPRRGGVWSFQRNKSLVFQMGSIYTEFQNLHPFSSGYTHVCDTTYNRKKNVWKFFDIRVWAAPYWDLGFRSRVLNWLLNIFVYFCSFWSVPHSRF